MKKKLLLKIVSVLYLMLCVLFLGGITVFADETNDLKPTHEYLFDNDSTKAVVNDSGKATHLNGQSMSEIAYALGYNEEGKSCHFRGGDSISFPYSVLPNGKRSIKFSFKKDASTISDRPEPILANINRFGEGFYIGIGKFSNNTVPGSLYILSQDKATVYYELETDRSICDGKWHDILFTWDGTISMNSIKLYIDDMTTPVVQVTPNSVEKYKQVNFSAGTCDYEPSGYTPPNFIGYLDNLKFYDLVIPPKSNASSNLKATGGDSKVDLTWNVVTDATSYTVKRSTTAGGPYTAIATGVTGTAYTDTGVTNGTTYYYVVTAIVNGSEGWNSNEASATPQASTDQPTGNKALLVITMVTGERKEYEMTTDKINDFVTWYNSKAASSPTYVIEKDYNKASFTARKDYIAYDQISNFEVNEYND